jgi:AcrR family transcriptional regulator
MLSDRQEQIIDESIKIISERGIQGMTIKNLSKAIGISEPGIYRHFNSKTEIILGILTRFQELAISFSQNVKVQQINSVEKIRFIFSQMIQTFAENPSTVSVFFAEEIFNNEAILKNKIIEIGEMHAKTIEQIVIVGQADNIIRKDIDAKSLTLVLMGSLRFTVKSWDFFDHAFDLKQEGSKIIEVLTKILK